MNRRELLQFAGTYAAAAFVTPLADLTQAAASEQAASSGMAGGEAPFSEDGLHALAQDLAKKPFQLPKLQLPDAFLNMGYDQYRGIRSGQGIWKGEGLAFHLEFFHAGFIYKVPVKIYLVDAGRSKELRYSPSFFIFPPDLKAPPSDADGFSGFRIHTPVHHAGKHDEFALFQGASYFRAIATGQGYGLSARGLAINTGQKAGEEFPVFRSFWIEQPKPGEERIAVYGLLDSVSVTGVYKFTIYNRHSTVMEIDCALYPRQAMPYVGIAPLTSMFFFGPSDHSKYDDFRPSVHDSDGLAIWNGGGEHIWRPLINPERLQFSVFMDNNPKGFGLLQRNRNFADYQDLEARYERRPSLWVEPLENWGEGSVDLAEIPTGGEWADNIVAFWRPKNGLKADKSHRFRYRLHWCWEPPLRRNFSHISQTRVGTNGGARLFQIDFAGTEGLELCDAFDESCPDKRRNLELTASTGAVSNIVFRRNPSLGGHRLSFEFRPKGSEPSDLRCALLSHGKPLSEVWTYRWTA